MTDRLHRMEGSARFAAAMSMAVSSGLSIETKLKAVEMAVKMDFDKDTKAAILKIKESMDEGTEFADAMKESGLVFKYLQQNDRTRRKIRQHGPCA